MEDWICVAFRNTTNPLRGKISISLQTKMTFYVTCLGFDDKSYKHGFEFICIWGLEAFKSLNLVRRSWRLVPVSDDQFRCL